MIASVLLADEAESARTQLDQFLSTHLIDVDSVGSATECIRRLRERRYDALILGVELKWGGAEGVLAVLNEEPALSNIPVILTSSIIGDSELATFVKWPVVHSLSKPFSPTALLQRILDATRSSRSRQSPYNESLRPPSSALGR